MSPFFASLFRKPQNRNLRKRNTEKSIVIESILRITTQVISYPYFLLMFSFAEYKKYRAHIKKKSEQVLRLRKKAKTGGHKTSTSVSDPSVQRLIEQSNRDLNQQYKQLYDTEKQCLRKILTEERHR